MTRFSGFLFNIIFILAIYGIIYINGGKADALIYVSTYFIAPYVLVNILMAILALLRWFPKQNAEMAKECITFLHAAWFTTLLAFLAHRLIISQGHFAKMFVGIPLVNEYPQICHITRNF
ncbi:MAG: hypothetical protein WCJ33_09235, partial [Pseudomonadota bacterium]